MEREPILEVLQVVSPEILNQSLQVGLGAGVIGICVGGAAGTIRRTTPILFAVVSGLQCSAIGSTFWATRSLANVFQARKSGSNVYALTSRQQLATSTFAGWFTGGFLGAALRGHRNILPGMFIFSSLGFIGQSLVNARQNRQPVDLPFPDDPQTILERVMNSKYFPMRKLSDAEYEGKLQDRMIRLEAEIAIIDENIEKAKGEMESNANTTPLND